MPNETNDPLIGHQLDEYRLESLLGRGGMARVYRGQDVRLRRYVAVKVIDTPFQAESEYITRFEREAQAIAQLEHPNIVRLYRYGDADKMLYIAMQYIEGVDLQTMLVSYEEQFELMAAADVGRIIREICHALDYAHSKGVIHRDMKPANVIIDEAGDAFIADFGLALMTELGTQGEIFGTPQYIAPEQAISSAGAVSQSDLYAVGVILYRMLTGVLPFTAEDPLEVAMWHMTETPPPPSEIRPSITPELEAVVLKALAKEPKDRYPTGAALADAVDNALASFTQSLTTTAVPALSIPQRVSLNREALPALTPPIISAQTPPLAQPQLTPIPENEDDELLFGVPRNWLIIGGVVLLVLLALWLGFSGFGDGEDDDEVSSESTAIVSETVGTSAATSLLPESTAVSGYPAPETTDSAVANENETDALESPELPSDSVEQTAVSGYPAPEATEDVVEEDVVEVEEVVEETAVPLSTETPMPADSDENNSPPPNQSTIEQLYLPLIFNK